MKIAQIAPLVESVPPTLYGGTERVVSWLTEELVRQGHEVTLFASGDSRTAAELVPIVPRALRLDGIHNSTPYNAVMLDQVALRQNEFDVLHFHIDLLHFPFFETIAERTLTTLHGRLDIKDLPGAYQRWPQYPLISISDHQRRPLPAANWFATVPHGVPTERFRFSEAPGEHLVFVGRFSPEKRPDRAIEIAQRACMQLVLAAKVDPVDRPYFHAVVEPLLQGPYVEFVGEVDDQAKNELLGRAAALLFPIDWPEPFGLVMIEAMACGTPVIAWDNGAVREVVEDGVTGFIVDSIDAAVAAVARLDTIDRRRVRATFERRFSATTMAKKYADLYTRLRAPAHDRPQAVRA